MRGPVDGLMGDQTRSAIEDWQQKQRPSPEPESRAVVCSSGCGRADRGRLVGRPPPRDGSRAMLTARPARPRYTSSRLVRAPVVAPAPARSALPEWRRPPPKARPVTKPAPAPVIAPPAARSRGSVPQAVTIRARAVMARAAAGAGRRSIRIKLLDRVGAAVALAPLFEIATAKDRRQHRRLESTWGEAVIRADAATGNRRSSRRRGERMDAQSSP